MAKAEPAAPAPRPRNTVVIALRDANEKIDDATARELIKPSIQAAATIQKWQGEGNQEVNALAQSLSAQIVAVNNGDLSRVEGILAAQAHTLDEIFNNLARRAHCQIDAGYIDAGDCYLRLALKAQSQCRSTLEAIAEIKNPHAVSFVKQANIAHGHQQVNNGTPAGESHAHGENVNPSNELSGGSHELLSDTRASAPASRVNQEVETVEAINRAAD